MVSKNCPIIGKHIVIIFITLYATIATVWLAKNTLNLAISKTARWNFFLLSNFSKKDKMQLLAKFKKILYTRFRATLRLRSISAAFSSLVTGEEHGLLSRTAAGNRAYLTIFRKNFTVPFWKYNRLKLKLRVFLASYSAALVPILSQKWYQRVHRWLGIFWIPWL